MKKVDDFKKAARDQGVKRWNVHNCSICGYKCGYVINGDNVYYDSGCDCVMGGLEPRDWEDIANSYNLNAGADDAEERSKEYPLFAGCVREDNKLWGFDNPEWLDV